MDITLELFNVTDKQLDNYVDEIKKSDLSKWTQEELIDLFSTMKRQVAQARAMGWYPPGI